MANKYLNTFQTVAQYEEYIAGSVDQYPNIAYVEATDSVYVLEEEHIPVFSIKVMDEWGTEYSDGGTFEGDGEQQDDLYVEGYLDGQRISVDDFSVAGNNDLSFRDSVAYYIASLPYGYDNTYNYTITATCQEQTVTFSLTYVQASTPSFDYSISVSHVEEGHVEEGGELVPNEGYWVELTDEYDSVVQEPFDGDFVVECSGEGYFTYNFDRDYIGGVDGMFTFDGAEDGDTITISYVRDGTTLASSNFVASVSSGGDYRLVLSTCNPEGDVNNICETQGFCSDSDYYVILLNQGELVNHTDQLVTYYSIAYGENITPSLDGGGSCVWQCSSFDPSIEVVVCYDSNNNIIAYLETSCE